MNPDLFNALMNYSNAMKTFLPQDQQIQPQMQMPPQQMQPQMQAPPQQNLSLMPSYMYQPQNLAGSGLDPGLSGGSSPGFTKKQNPLNDSSGGGGGGMGMLSGVLGGMAGGF